jgi:GT2 family glycosyltransferase
MNESHFKKKISVVIVNYNVEFFLEQCLNSVRKALEHVSGEIFVVDNNSIDGSVEMVRNKFPEVKLIANKDNRGFSKANNQAMEIAEGEYILLLNPDTVVEENTFEKVVQFMDEHPDAGGLGVRMLDGKGKFLPESKRGLPTPAVAFYKIFGLSRLFPKSKRFGQYHLGFLDEFETNEIDILSGAFMLMRKSALDKVGLLDEAFFMYGEDIDLSYRIQKGGYKNYYYPETRIIHYKGESTKKSSVNYVFVFYRAMVIFASKHFSQKNARLFSLLINLAIYFRASIALFSRFIQRSLLPLTDGFILALSLYSLTFFWREHGIQFPDEIIRYAIPVYLFIWMTSVLFTGGYDRPYRLKKYPVGVFIGLIVILAVYGLLPKDLQFSRLYILLGALATLVYFLVSRALFHFFLGGRFSLTPTANKRFLIVGSSSEFRRISDILKQTGSKIDVILHLSSTAQKEADAIGTINQLDQVIHIHKIDEIIFSAQDNTAQTIIHWMSALPSKNIDFKIAQPETLFLIGSNSIDTAGDLYVLNINSISKPEQKRSKRVFDIFVALGLLLLSPFVIWNYRQKPRFLKNVLSILNGRYSVVGYHVETLHSSEGLPRLKKGILSPADDISISDPDLIDKLNLIYARDYSVAKDLSILKKGWKRLDR